MNLKQMQQKMWEKFAKEFPANHISEWRDEELRDMIDRKWFMDTITAEVWAAAQEDATRTSNSGRRLFQEGYAAALDAVEKEIDKHDPSINRKTSVAYWGNTLRAAINNLRK